jgi:hypothetical protein
MPVHMDGDVTSSAPWIAKVSQRKAPGAMRAIAFMVNPVRPSVGFISGAVLSAIDNLLLRISFGGQYEGRALGRSRSGLTNDAT